MTRSTRVPIIPIVLREMLLGSTAHRDGKSAYDYLSEAEFAHVLPRKTNPQSGLGNNGKELATRFSLQILTALLHCKIGENPDSTRNGRAGALEFNHQAERDSALSVLG